MKPKLTALGSAMLLFCTCLIAASISAAPKQVYKMPPEMAWTQEEWTGSDKPFLSIQRSIDQIISKGSKPDDLREKYKWLAEKEPTDAKAQFRWAYAADRAADRKQSKEVENRLHGIADAMNKPASPNSYQYGRLRYLVEKYGPRKNSWFLHEFGKRLVKRDPKDWDVKFYVTYDLLMGEDVTDRRVTALKYAQEIRKAFPDRPSSYGMLGSVYNNLHMETRNPRYADIAISNYRKYLQLAPKNYEFRKRVPNLIKMIENDKVRYLKARK